MYSRVIHKLIIFTVIYITRFIGVNFKIEIDI